MVRVVMFLIGTAIQGMSSLYLGYDNEHNNRGSSSFPQSLQANAGNNTSN